MQGGVPRSSPWPRREPQWSTAGCRHAGSAQPTAPAPGQRTRCPGCGSCPSPKSSCPRVPPQSPRVPAEAVKGGAHSQACREPPWREKTPASPGACILSTLEHRSVHDALSERAGHLPLSAHAAVRPAGACLAWRSPPWPGWRGSHSLCPSLAVQPQPGDLRCHPVPELRSPLKAPGRTPSASAFPRASAPARFSCSLPRTQKAQFSPPAPEEHPQERGRGRRPDPARTVTPLPCRAPAVLPGPCR